MIGKKDIENLEKIEDRTLRDYQRENKQKIYDAWKTCQSVMLQMPTGTGKTWLFTSIVKDFYEYRKSGRRFKILLMAHRKELIDQIKEAIEKNIKVTPGIIRSTEEECSSKRIQVASVDTLKNDKRLDKWQKKNFDLIIVDEAHHILANKYRRIIEAFPQAKLLGVTATPCRTSGEGFADLFDKIIVSRPIAEFIHNGYLCDYKYYSIPTYSESLRALEGVRKQTGDYLNCDLDSRLNNKKIRAQVVEMYKKYADGLHGIVFAINKEHSKRLKEDFLANGISAECIDSDTNKKTRDDIIKNFKNGEINVLCNVDIFTEGYDCSGIEFVQLARPTISLSLHIQQIGRGLRQNASNDKTCIFLDNVGAYYQFGFPTREYDWETIFNGFSANKENSEYPRLIKASCSERESNLEEGNEKLILVNFSDDSEYRNNEIKKIIDLYSELDEYIDKKEKQVYKQIFRNDETIAKFENAKFKLYLVENDGYTTILNKIIQLWFSWYNENDKICHFPFIEQWKKELKGIDEPYHEMAFKEDEYTIEDVHVKTIADFIKGANYWNALEILTLSKSKIALYKKQLTKYDKSIVSLVWSMYIQAYYDYYMKPDGIKGFAACNDLFEYFPVSFYKAHYESDYDESSISNLVSYFWKDLIAERENLVATYRLQLKEIRSIVHVDFDENEFNEDMDKTSTEDLIDRTSRYEERKKDILVAMERLKKENASS